MKWRFVGSFSRQYWLSLLGLAVVGTVWMLLTGTAVEPSRLRTASQAALRRPAGHAQLISTQPLPEMDGPACEWMPASATETLAATLRRQETAASADEPRAAVDADRPPLRVIRDTFPTYSAITVDLVADEVYLQDENLFGLKIFDRLADTPPAASFTEPKRILGGVDTKLEFNCGLYVDPVSGDVYSVNNDTVDTLVIFGRGAQGNVPPKRELHTPHRTYGIAVDEERQEMYLAVQYPPQVVVYPKTASGDDPPIRVLEGPSTQLEDAHGIAIDTRRNLMFVSNHGSDSNYQVPGSGKFHPPSITVYPLDARGDTAPLRIIEGPRTRLNWPAALAVDPERGELYVANDADDSILVFPETASGDVAPARLLRGPATGIHNPTGVFVDRKNQELWVSNMGNHSATVYPLAAAGNMAPLRTIRSAPAGKQALAIGNPGAVAYDGKREEILVPN